MTVEKRLATEPINETVIRSVEPAELARAGELVVDAYRALLGSGLDEGYAAHLADVAWRASRANVLVAVKDSILSGCITYVGDANSPLAEGLIGGEAGIRMLAVDPGQQGKGCGRALVMFCIELAKSAGAEAVFLHSTTEMTMAHKLYESLGFLRVPSRDWQPSPNVQLLGFRLPLQPEPQVRS